MLLTSTDDQPVREIQLDTASPSHHTTRRNQTRPAPEDCKKRDLVEVPGVRQFGTQRVTYFTAIACSDQKPESQRPAGNCHYGDNQ